MKSLSQILLVALLPLLAGSLNAATNISIAGGSSARPDCPVLSDGTVDTLELDDGRAPYENRCISDVQTLKMNLFKVGLCKSAPDPSNPTTDWYDKCVFILDKASNPIEVAFSLGAPQTISGIDLSKLTEGTYTHAVVLEQNKWFFKSKQLFSQPFQGRSSAGNLCYTVANASYNKLATTLLSDLSVECVANEAAVLANGNYGWMYNETFWIGSAQPVKTMTSGNKLYLLSDQTTLATIDDGNKTSDAGYELLLVNFSAPLTIDANTKNIDLGFAMVGYGRMEFSTVGPCTDSARTAGTEGCINAMKTNDFDLKVKID